MITQGSSEILQEAWQMYSYQYNKPMDNFVTVMFETIRAPPVEEHASPNYFRMSLTVLDI